MATSIRLSSRLLLTAVFAVLTFCPEIGGSQVVGSQKGSWTSPADSVPGVRLDSLLDLETVIRRALDVSPTVTSAEQGVRTAQSEGRVAHGEYLPSLAATSSVLSSNAVPAPSVGTPPPAYAAGLAASIDVFTGGRRDADRARATADLSAAQATNVSQRFATTFAAQSAFYQTLRAGDLVDVARASVTQAEAGLRYAQDREQAGTATPSDVLRARLQVTTTRQQLIAALDTLQSSAYSLGRLVGADGPIGARRPASLEPRPLALGDSDIVRLAVEASPVVRATQAQENADAALLRAARTEYVPDLRITTGYNWANQSSTVYAVHPGWRCCSARRIRFSTATSARTTSFAPMRPPRWRM